MHNIVGADPPYPLCSNHSHYADNSSFHHSLNNLFYTLSSNSSVSKFYNTYAGNNLDRVYGLYMCFGNTTIEVCNTCISTASQDILKHCPNRKEAIIWEEHCQLRYSNTKFFSTLDIIGNQAQRNSMNILESERRRFKDALNITLSRAVKDAVYDPSPDMYAAKKVRYLKSETLYAQVQCTGDLLANDCNTCLQIAINNASSCCNSSLGARIYSKSCYLRYEVYDFDGGAFEEIQMTAKNSKWKIWVTMIFVVSAFLAVTLLGSFVYCLKMKLLHNIVGADPPYPLCSNHSRYADNSSFHHSLNNLFYSLSSNSSVSKFYNTYAGNNLDRVYGLYMCFGNTTIEVCNSCISTASQDILKHCPNRKEAIIWEEHCQLRYSNTNFFSTLDIIGNQAQRNSMNILEPERRRFKDALNITLSRAVKDAVYDPSPDMYAAKKVRYLKSETLYAQVQCTGDLLANDCNTCLQIAINNASSCCNSSLGARIYSKSCYLRYEVYDFDGGAFEEIQMTAKSKFL
ncbi:hypothetical protein FEM48_Zijuj01G0133900 [Ziziphus jujuba var. spinosa]|uniref:Gnk2-homologous domain-containing protein n=1 Tax=Ziziphus jujuba var. spinosa TaxID=714518 RepID=A0A978W1I1_ZIZJJ|nr:hypothetical protein FEM48_Zijuj01G0133900 [Ziziphus jujuba var. spinosa]